MQVLIYSDVHFSESGSIINSFGDKYKTRLEYLIKSLNWAEKLATDLGCEAVFNLGDTFDKSIISAMEATALQEVKWNNLPHYVLVGNHDSDIASLAFSSSSVLKKLGFDIINKVKHVKGNDGTMFTFIPYTGDDSRKPFVEYLEGKDNIVLSHNDIAGVNLGKFISKRGFKLDEIKSNCKYFLNGHLHNCDFVEKNVLNVGNLCGQNFKEDATRYAHGCWVLDTQTNELKFYENPYAFNFYKLEYPKDLNILQNLKDNSALMIKCERKLQAELRSLLASQSNKIVATRVILYDEEVLSSEDSIIKLEKVDHLQQFIDFIHEQIGNTELVNHELAEVCK